MSASKKSLMIRYRNLLIVIWCIGVAMCVRLFWNTIVNSENWNNRVERSSNITTNLNPKRGSIMDADRYPIAVNIDLYNLSVDLGAGSFKADTLKKYLNPLCDSLALMAPEKTSQEWKDYITEHYDNFKARKDAIEQYKRENESKINNIGAIRDSISKLEKGIKATNSPAQKKIKQDKINKFQAELNDIRSNLRNPHRHMKLKKECDIKELDRLKTFPFFNKKSGRKTIAKERIVKRIKPYGTFAARTIGNTFENEKHEIHGRTGLESSLDSLLFGVPGKAKKMAVLKNNRFWETEPAINGYDVVTSIDIRIQDILERQLYNICVERKAEWGTAIIMEVATGEIKAISNLDRIKGTDEFHETVNHAFLGYEPGSTIKPISMMIFLEDGFVNVNQPISIPSRYHYPTATFKPVTDSHACKTGYYTPIQIIEQSSNVGMTRLLERKYKAVPSEFYDRLREIGMFDRLNVGIAGETLPFFPKLGTRNRDRSALARIAFGYSSQIPPIYTAALYNAIANNGKFVRPRLVKELWRDGVCDTVFPISYVRERVCSEKNAKILQQMLRGVVLNGTGKGLRNNFISIAGKTGTANVIEGGRYLYGLGNNRVSFCGFFPYENPKYTCMVTISRPNCGATLASGMVLLRTALEMHARGMLDRYSNFKTEEDNKPNERMKIHALNNNELQTVREEVNARKMTTIRNKNVTEGTPCVEGLGLRDAVERLERAGFNVSVEGVGYVYSQSIKPGTPFEQGDKIMLKLRNE